MNKVIYRFDENMWLRGLGLLVGGLFVCFIFFKEQLTDHFSFAFGDMYDGIIADTLVSHWYSVFHGKAVWNQIPYFYPYADTLGYNDGYFLHGLIAAVFRLFGIDFIRSADLALIAIKLIGYFSMFGLLQSIRRGALINLLVTVLFSMTLLSANANGHVQLITVAFSPLFALLAISAFKARNDQTKAKFLLLAVCFAILYGAWLLTAFYMAFFFTLFLIFFVIAYALTHRKIWPGEFYDLLANWKSLIVVAVVLALSLYPFVLVYLPKVRETGGGQHLSAAMFFMQKPADIFNFGPHRLAWEWLYPSLDRLLHFSPGEQVTGFVPVFFVVFLISGYAAAKNSAHDRTDKVTAAVFFATLALLVCTLKFGGFSLWKVVYYAIPGAKGVRVISRLWLFLPFPMCIVIANRLRTVHRKTKGFLVLLLCFMIFEQIDRFAFVGLDVDKEFKLVVDAPRPPTNCQSFYGINAAPYPAIDSPADHPLDLIYRVNVQSMAIAGQLDLPTINGNSTFNPPDWNFSEAPPETYIQRVRAFVTAHHLLNVCQYDITNKVWSSLPHGN